MATVNISLLSEQMQFIDELVTRYQFANRSEFFRSVLRLLKTHPELISSASTHPFIAPSERSVKKVMASFTKSKKYSPEFLKDLEEGLADSTYFTK